MTICLSIIGAIIALTEVGFLIFQYAKESVRRRRSETITVYNQIFNDTYKLRDQYSTTTQNTSFAAEEIYKNPDLYKNIMGLLTTLESFSKGLEYGVYDFKTFVYLTPNEMFEILCSLKQFVYEERKKKSYDLLFDGFIYLTDILSISIQTKLSGKDIHFKYTKLKRRR